MNNRNISFNSAENLTITYEIEYINSKKDYDRLEKHSAPWELYNKQYLNNLEDAIQAYTNKYMIMAFRLYQDPPLDIAVYDVKMWMITKIDCEIVREEIITDYKVDTIKDFVNRSLNNENKKKQQKIEYIAAENELMRSFISEYNAETLFKKFQQKKFNEISDKSR